MKERILSPKMIADYVNWLRVEEKSAATVLKYERDVNAFYTFQNQEPVKKESLIAYKHRLMTQHYAISSINSMLASVNSLFVYLGWDDCKVKSLRVQRQTYCSENKELSKEEYLRLVSAAQNMGNRRMELILQTICSTGIRVSELQFVTVEAVECGEAVVSCKSKTRKVFIVTNLQQKLRHFIAENNIVSGPVFVTSRGKLVNRTNIWREMKKLCKNAKVNPEKVTPHNLRHLFARTFYGIDKDLAKLADILGHSSINTTRIYIIATGNEHKQCMERLQLTV